MEENGMWKMLIYFGKRDRIWDGFLEGKGYSKGEIKKAEELGYIVYVGMGKSDNRQYMITDLGIEFRNR